MNYEDVYEFQFGDRTFYPHVLPVGGTCIEFNQNRRFHKQFTLGRMKGANGTTPLPPVMRVKQNIRDLLVRNKIKYFTHTRFWFQVVRITKPALGQDLGELQACVNADYWFVFESEQDKMMAKLILPAESYRPPSGTTSFMRFGG